MPECSSCFPTPNANRIWAAVDVLAELDALSAAIGQRTTSQA